MRRVPGVVAVGRTGDRRRHRTTTATPAFRCPGEPEPVTIGIYRVDPGFFETMGIELVAGRLLRREPADGRRDHALPADDPDAERALVARGANVVDQRARGAAAGLPATRQTRSASTVKAGIVDARISAWCRSTIIGVVARLRASARSASRSIRSCSIYDQRSATTCMIVRYDGAIPPSVPRPASSRSGSGSPPTCRSTREFSEDIVAELYEAEEARAQDLRRLRAARGGRRLPRPVRPRRLHRRAAHQGDRHPQGARRAHPRHRPAARLAILQAGDHRQSDRLAGRLVGDARLAEQLRRAHRPRARRPFVLAGLLALAIAIGTIAGHAFKVARANPIHALRYE